MEDLMHFFAYALYKLGGAMTITADEWDGFADQDYRLAVELLANGDTAFSLEKEDA